MTLRYSGLMEMRLKYLGDSRYSVKFRVLSRHRTWQTERIVNVPSQQRTTHEDPAFERAIGFDNAAMIACEDVALRTRSLNLPFAYDEHGKFRIRRKKHHDSAN